MPNVTRKLAGMDDRYPVGTSVSLYKRSQQSTPAHPPPGTASRWRRVSRGNRGNRAELASSTQGSLGAEATAPDDGPPHSTLPQRRPCMLISTKLRAPVVALIAALCLAVAAGPASADTKG